MGTHWKSLGKAFPVSAYKICFGPEIMKKIFCKYSLYHVLVHIMKTCPYNTDPLKPHFYLVKVGFTEVYIIFLISAQNIESGYSLEPSQ